MGVGDGERTRRLLLAVGYLAFAGAVLAAWLEPARGYEIDIYAATPLAFWIGVAAAVAIALFVAFHDAAARPVRLAALALASGAVLAVVALPILRSYYFYGPGDSLSHLGFARLMADGRLSPLGFLYPGIHSIAVFVTRVMGYPLTRSLLYVQVLFAAVYAVFLPLLVAQLSSRPLAVATGTVAGLLFLPINNVSVYLLPYPTTQALFFVPLIAYLLVKYVTVPDGTFPRFPTGVGLLLAITSVTVVLLHPQQAGSVLLLFGGVVAVQFLYRRFADEHPVSRQRPLYAQTAVLAAAFLLWTPRFNRAQSATTNLFEGLVGPQQIGDEIATRAGSLDVLGGGVLELGGKLFGVSLLLSAVAAVAMLATLQGRLDDRPRLGVTARYFSVGLVLLSGAFLAFFLASFSVLPFRYLGAVMVVVTVLAVVGLLEVVPAVVPVPSGRALAVAAVVVLGALLALQAAHLHSSPYIYQPSNQVTETSVEGYGTAFQFRSPDVWYAGIQSGPRRYIDAVYGTTFDDRTPGGKVFEGRTERVPPAVLGTNVTSHYTRDRYVPVTGADVAREIELYRGLRYTPEGFRRLESTPMIHRVVSNGNFRLYYVDEPDE